MTQQDDITQRVLTTEKRKEFIRRTSFISECDRDTRAAFVDEIVRAALASAPVAEPRLEWSAKALYDAIKDVLLNHRLSNWVNGDGESFPLVDHLCSKDAKTTESGEFEIALICDAIYNDVLTKSAPVAPATDRAMLQSVLQDLEKSESVCPRCGHSDSCADMDVAHMIRDHLKGDASTPVAGEAQPLGYVRKGREWPNQCYYPSSHKPTDIHNWTPVFDHAAPQPSAYTGITTSDHARNAALEALEAAQRFIRNGIELGYIRMPYADTPDPAQRTPDLIDAAIRALKQPQADKDGGQQRAGEVDERAAFEAWAYRAGMGPKFRESMFAAWEARAALSAPQAEQGERDA